ncbi:MAG: lysophospholipid acyltransferase family protein, partial [Ignavibacteriota bacterium]
SAVLFPEGTRTANGEVQHFKRGAFHLAFESKTKVIPVAIAGSFEWMPRTALLPRSNKVVHVSIGKPLEFSNDIESDRDCEIDLMKRSEIEIRKQLLLLKTGPDSDPM